MRLPAISKKHIDNENARQLNEDIWYAHLANRPFVLPGNPEPECSRRAAQIQGNLHNFWRARGFKMRATLTPDRRIQIVLEPGPVKQRRPVKVAA